MKRLVALLAAFMVAASLLVMSPIAHAASAPQTLILGTSDGTGVTVVSGGSVVSANAGTAGVGAYWYADGTLYLNGLDLTGMYYNNGEANVALYAKGDLSIVVVDGTTNVIGTQSAFTGAGGGSVLCKTGLWVDDGVLSISGGAAKSGILCCYGYMLYDDVTSLGADDTCGIHVEDTDDSGNDAGLAIKDVVLYAEAGRHGIYLEGDGATLSVNGATLTATALPDQKYSECGIYALCDSVSFTDSTVAVNGPAVALYVQGSLTIEHSRVDAKVNAISGIEYTDIAYFTSYNVIFTYDCRILSNSDVTMSAESPNNCAALCCRKEGGCLIDDSSVTASNVEAGIISPSGNVIFRNEAHVSLSTVSLGILGYPDVNFELTGDGYVEATGQEMACGAFSPKTINLAAGNVIERPVGGTAGPYIEGSMTEPIYVIMEASGTFAVDIRVAAHPLDVNPKTGMSEVGLYVISLVMISIAAICLYSVRRRVH